MMTSTKLLPVSHALLSLAAALALAACTLPTKLAELTAGEETSAGATGTTADPEPTAGTSGFVTGDDSSGGPQCNEVQVVSTPLSPNVVLVLDKSGSMVSDPNGFWDHDNDPGTAPVTRWSSLHTVVETLTTDFGDAINFGAHLFPSVNATSQYSFESCIVDANITVAVAASNKDAILAGIPAEDNVTLRGGTPIASGVIVAVDHLKTLDPLVPRAIVLVTDGAANCAAGAEAPELFEVYDENVHTVVGDAFTIDGIPTYVVGVGIADVVSSTEQDGNPDSTNTFSRLNELATDGGKPRSDPSQKFYNTINQIELAAALGEIAFDALTCIIPLESSQIAPGGTGVEVDGAPIPFVTDCSTQDGWMYTNPQGPFDAIRLCGSACGGLKLVGEASITVCQL